MVLPPPGYSFAGARRAAMNCCSRGGRLGNNRVAALTRLLHHCRIASASKRPMPQTAFEATNSWCYHFARYEALPQIMRMPEVTSGQPFRLVEFVKKVMNEHLTPSQQETKYARRDTGESLSIAATVKFYVPFVAKNTQQLVRLGGGMFRIPSVEDVDDEADEAAETALSGRLGEDGDVGDFDGWIYAFTFPALVHERGRFPIKIGRTVVDVEARILGQCRSSAAFDRPLILGRWPVKRVVVVESAIHQVLKARGLWREQALGSEWFDTRLEEVAEILNFVTRV